MSYSGTNYIKTNTWRFVDDGERSQLYKTSEDPYEWDNLYNKPGYEDIINGLKHQMDSMLLPGTKIRETLLSDPKNTMVAEPHKKIKKRKSDSEDVITSYSIHYTKLYDCQPLRKLPRNSQQEPLALVFSAVFNILAKQ